MGKQVTLVFTALGRIIYGTAKARGGYGLVLKLVGSAN